MQDLDIAQKRALVAKKIRALRNEARNEAQSLLGEKHQQGPDLLLTLGGLDTLEILLLLLWRHLQYYAETRPAGSQIQASTPLITRLVTSMNAESFRADVPRKLGTLLQRLDALDLVIAMHMSQQTHADMDPSRQNTESLTENGEWRFNRAYIETISKRLKETVGLWEPENNGQGAI